MMKKETKYDTLILSGGSEKILASMGALSAIPEECCWNTCKTIVGTSAGALLGMMIALRMSFDECLDMIRNYFSESLKLDSSLVPMDDLSPGVFDGRKIIGDFVRTALYERLGKINCTMREFAQATGVDLIVTACNVTDCKTDFLCAQDTPTIDMVTAMSMTTCIPFLFRPIEWEGKTYVDGAVYGEVMTTWFDRTAYNVIPCKTLLIYVEVPPTYSNEETIFSFASNLLHGMMYCRNKDTLKFFATKCDTVVIRVDGCFSLERALTCKDDFFRLDEETIQSLVRSGREAVFSSCSTTDDSDT